MKKFNLEVDEIQIRVIRDALSTYEINLLCYPEENIFINDELTTNSRTNNKVAQSFIDKSINPIVKQINTHLH